MNTNETIKIKKSVFISFEVLLKNIIMFSGSKVDKIDSYMHSFVLFYLLNKIFFAISTHIISSKRIFTFWVLFPVHKIQFNIFKWQRFFFLFLSLDILCLWYLLCLLNHKLWPKKKKHQVKKMSFWIIIF